MKSIVLRGMFKARILQIIRFVRVFEKIFGNFGRIFGKLSEGPESWRVVEKKMSTNG